MLGSLYSCAEGSIGLVGVGKGSGGGPGMWLLIIEVRCRFSSAAVADRPRTSHSLTR